MGKCDGDSYTEIYYKNELIREGWRNPLTRINSVPFDFNNKTVLDLGCNCGGTLFAVADKIKFGLGVDIVPEAIEAADETANKNHIVNVNFRVLDLTKKTHIEKLPKTDIVFALSIAKHINNWRDIIEILEPQYCLFEANGGRDGGTIPDQMSWLKTKFTKADILMEEYESTRKLILCEGFIKESE